MEENPVQWVVVDGKCVPIKSDPDGDQTEKSRHSSGSDRDAPINKVAYHFSRTVHEDSLPKDNSPGDLSPQPNEKGLEGKNASVNKFKVDEFEDIEDFEEDVSDDSDSYLSGEDSDDSDILQNSIPFSRASPIPDLPASDSTKDNHLQAPKSEHRWNWQNGDLIREPFQFQVPHQCCITAQLGDEPNMKDFVDIFITDADFQDILTETNRALIQKKLNNETVCSHFKDWPEEGITLSDLKCFFALTVAMGLVNQESIGLYWSTDPVLRTPFFPEVMPRDFFLLILSCLSLPDSKDHSLGVKVGKLGRFYYDLQDRFLNAWSPGQDLFLTEGIVPYNDKSYSKGFNPKEPRCDFKIYQLCDSSNGYCSRFGLSADDGQNPANSTGATYDLVFRLIDPLRDQGHILYTDNLFSNPKLFFDLYELMGTGATGMTEDGADFPEILNQKKLAKRGDYKVMHHRPLTAVKFQDRKADYFLSSVHGMNMVRTGKRSRDGTIVQSKHEVVYKYNQNMGNLESSSYQPIHGNALQRKTNKCWKGVFFHLYNLAIGNAYVLYKEHCMVTHQTPKLQQEFCSAYAKALVEEAGPLPATTRRPGRQPQSVESLQRLTPHVPRKIRSASKAKRPGRGCVLCQPAERQMQARGEKPFRKETTIECGACQKALCLIPCFGIYHTFNDAVAEYKRLKQTNS